jgi:hypothetical protein
MLLSVTTLKAQDTTIVELEMVDEATEQVVKKNKEIDYIYMSQDFLYAARADGDAAPYIDSFANVNEKVLLAQLKTENDKKAFFINLYNAYTQYILKKSPGKYKKRNAFFKAKQINLAGNQISLDKIENGFLRRSKVKLGLGYIGKLFPGKLEKKFRVSKVDYRIHFTLNCGAASCPAIAYYKPEKLEEQLEDATSAYLKGEVEYKKEENKLYLPATMSWFRGDFGGKNKQIKLIKKLGIIPSDASPKIKYKSYNWDLYLKNYKK